MRARAQAQTRARARAQTRARVRARAQTRARAREAVLDRMNREVRRTLAHASSSHGRVTIDRPLHAELVGEIPVVVAPELLLEGHRHTPIGRQRFEQRLGPLGPVLLDENGTSLHRLRVRSVGRAEPKPGAFEYGMQHLLTPGGTITLRHGRSFIPPKLSNLSKPTGLVKLKRSLTRAFEIQIRRDLHGVSPGPAGAAVYHRSTRRVTTPPRPLVGPDEARAHVGPDTKRFTQVPVGPSAITNSSSGADLRYTLPTQGMKRRSLRRLLYRKDGEPRLVVPGLAVLAGTIA